MQQEHEKDNGSIKLTFQEYILSANVAVHEMMLRPEAQNQIHQNAKKFADLCIQNNAFCTQLIKLAFFVTQFTSQQQKIVCSKSNDIICWNNPEILRIFIGSPDPKQVQKQTVEIEEQLQKQQNENHNKFQAKYKYLMELLDYLNRPKAQIENTSIGYISKFLANIIQFNCTSLFQFFKNKQQYLDKLIDYSGNFSGISQFLGKFTAQQNLKVSYRQTKQYIVQRMIVNMKTEQLLSQQQYVLLLDYIEILFMRNKYHNRDNQQIGVVSQRFVDEDVIQFFTRKVIDICSNPINKPQNQTLKNCLQYLIILANRILTDDQIDQFNYDENQARQDPTMDFQLNPILINYEKLLQIIPIQRYTSITRLAYYQFIIKISKNRYFEKIQFKNPKIVIHLMKIFKAQKTNGILKQYIVQLIQLIISRTQTFNQTEALMIVSSLGPIQKLYKNQECRAFVEKIVLILASHNPIFANHYNSLNIEKTIRNFITIIGIQLPFVRNRKSKGKQFNFLQKYRQKHQNQIEDKDRNNSRGSDSQIQEFQDGSLPRTLSSRINFEVQWMEDKNFLSQDSQNESDLVYERVPDKVSDRVSDRVKKGSSDFSSENQFQAQKNGILLLQSAQISRFKNEQEDFNQS